MKYLITLFFLAAVLTAKADSFADGLTVPATSATNAAAIFQLRDQSKAALQMTSTLSAPGTGTLVASFAYSIDGTNFETMPSLSVTNVCAGTSRVSTITRFDPSCLRAIKLLSITNSAASPATLQILINTTRKSPNI